jgi:polysaccharide pyruvyl transferase CsaB
VGSENLGDELLFSCLRGRLSELGADVVVLSKDPGATERVHRVRAVRPSDARATLREIAKADAFVFGAGGLIQDGTSVLSLPYHLSRVMMARACRVPFAGVGLGAGPLRFRGSRLLVRAALAGNRGISVRDAASARLLRECGVPNVRVTADLALALEPSDKPPLDRIVLALRSYREALLPGAMGGRVQAQERKLELALARALDQVSRQTGLHLRFLAFEGRRDEEFNRRVASHMTVRDVSFVTPHLRLPVFCT